MINLSEKIADSYRKNTPAKANPANPVTSRRRKLYQVIKERTGGDPSAELEYSLRIIKQERPKIESYVISKNEVPLENLEDLIMQAYQLRCNEIDSTAKILNVSDAEAGLFLEDDEAESEIANNPEAENFIGEFFAPIGLAAKHLTTHDSLDGSLIEGVTNTIGNMIDKGALKRAAQNKKAGIIGGISGGKKEYELLRTYLQNPANSDEKNLVLNGTITDTTQLRGYGGAAGTVGNAGGVKILAKDVIDKIAREKKNEVIRKNLPYIIIGLVVIIIVTILIVKNAKRK